ncbi:hypothetical protein EV361DRAFT_950134 [Lentinula raphanica]|uniref:Uncharacterized protein n=1 Tax=Lentinula raphanica TaxID=153919 RepID=A0AA38PGC7_9AGAR|nr:hypothetical protein F5878DRAFT_412230 [Lentinula raphanica]KAJ3970943.1 hypothetical protein EV361DRAFT_950134 [Lentinula raphanica]
MNVAYLILALISATYAVPITNNQPRPFQLGVDVTVEPRGGAGSRVLPSPLSLAAVFTAGVFVGYGFQLNKNEPESQSDSKSNDDLFNNQKFLSFMKEAVTLDRASSPSMIGQANSKGPLRYKFFLADGQKKTDDVLHKFAAGSATRRILKDFEPDRGTVQEEGGELSADLTMVGVQINSIFRVEQTRCPCNLYMRITEKVKLSEEPIWGVLIPIHRSATFDSDEGTYIHPINKMLDPHSARLSLPS